MKPKLGPSTAVLIWAGHEGRRLISGHSYHDNLLDGPIWDEEPAAAFNIHKATVLGSDSPNGRISLPLSSGSTKG